MIPPYYICVKNFLKAILNLLSILPETKKYPDITKFIYIDFGKLEAQKEFLSQIHKDNEGHKLP